MDELLNDLHICALNYAALLPDQAALDQIAHWPATFDAALHTTLADFDVAAGLLEAAKQQVRAFLGLNAPVHFLLLGRGSSIKEFSYVKAMAYTGLPYYNFLISTINKYVTRRWPANLLATLLKTGAPYQLPWDVMHLNDTEAQFYILFLSDAANELAQYITMHEHNPISDVPSTVEMLLFKSRLAATKCSLLLGATNAYEQACLGLEKTIYTWKHHATGFDDHYNLLASVCGPLSELANNLNAFKGVLSIWHAQTGFLINKIPNAAGIAAAHKASAVPFFDLTSIMLCAMIIILLLLGGHKIVKLKGHQKKNK